MVFEKNILTGSDIVNSIKMGDEYGKKHKSTISVRRKRNEPFV